MIASEIQDCRARWFVSRDLSIVEDETYQEIRVLPYHLKLITYHFSFTSSRGADDVGGSAGSTSEAPYGPGRCGDFSQWCNSARGTRYIPK